MGDLFNNTQVDIPDPTIAGGDESAGQVTETPKTDNVEAGTNVDTPAGGDVTPAEKPKWAGKYKDADAMYADFQKVQKSYDDLRPAYTKSTQELSEIRKALQQMQSGEVGQAQKAMSAEQKEVVDAVLKSVDNRLAPITEKQDVLELTNIVSEMARQHEDFGEFSEEIHKVLAENSYLWQGGKEKAMELAYTIVKAQSTNKAVDKAVAQGIATAQQTQSAKSQIDKSRATASVKNTEEKTPSDKLGDSIVNARRGTGSVFG